MDKETAREMWSKISCGDVATWGIIEEFATAVEAAQCERCAKIVEEYDPGVSYFIRAALAEEIRRA